jgi:hypothetical protein
LREVLERKEPARAEDMTKFKLIAVEFFDYLNSHKDCAEYVTDKTNSCYQLGRHLAAS